MKDVIYCPRILFANSKQQPSPRDYTLIEVDSFYSSKVDACIHIEKRLVGVELMIYDLSKTIVRDGPWPH